MFGQDGSVFFPFFQQHRQGDIGFRQLDGALLDPLFQHGLSMLKFSFHLFQTGDVDMGADDSAGASLFIPGHGLPSGQEPLPGAFLIPHSVFHLVARCYSLDMGLPQGQHSFSIIGMQQIFKGQVVADFILVLISQSSMPVFPDIHFTGVQIAVPDAIGGDIQGQTKTIIAFEQLCFNQPTLAYLLLQSQILCRQLLQQALFFAAALDTEDQFLRFTGLKREIIGAQPQGVNG